MYILLMTVHLLAASILVLVVLLQSGKAGDLASTFGGATSQTAFGARGAATLLTKVTAVCAVVFMLTSLGLALFHTQDSSSTIMDQAEPASQSEVAPEESPSTSPGSGQPAESESDQGSESSDTTASESEPDSPQ